MTARLTSVAELSDQLEVAAGRLVDASRRFSTAQWARPVGSRTADQHPVEAAVQALVTSLAELEHAVEVGPATPPAAWRSPAPAPYPGALPDRLAVVAHDLVAALRAAPDGQQVWYAAHLIPVGQLVAGAVAQVRATTMVATPR